jgi:dolichol-phosphate mannosyltransferase
MKLSVIIPAHNEDGCIRNTLEQLVQALTHAQVDYELLVVADHCTDRTEPNVADLTAHNPRIRCLTNPARPGFGLAVRAGLDAFSGDAAVIYMADASDSAVDLIQYHRHLEQGAECVFGSRFIPGGQVVDYPLHKLILNRLVNWFIRLMFRHGLNDTTNAFKAYRREVIDGCRPFLSPHFNLTVELPLKAVIRGYRYDIIPITWRQRQTGESKLRIKEMGARYFFIILYCFIERLLTGQDYRRGHP